MYSERLNLSIQIAKDAGEILLKHYQSGLKPELKADNSFVSQADKESQDFICSQISKHFPGENFLGEEDYSGESIEGKSVWIVDPLDGTNNFLLGIPHFCVSIGFVVNQSSKLGVIYNPVTKDLFCAEEKAGAYFNHSKMQKNTTKINSAIMGRYFSDTKMAIDIASQLSELHLFFRQFDVVRSLGAAALDMAYLASGKANFYWQRGLQIWDIAAAACILNELSIDIKNENSQSFLIGKDSAVVISLNPEIEKNFYQVIGK